MAEADLMTGEERDPAAASTTRAETTAVGKGLLNWVSSIIRKARLELLTRSS
jgi:hypothetical protein